MLVMLVLNLGPALASDPKPEGSSSHDAKQQALRQIPLQLLSEQARQKLTPVLDSPSIFRRMPSQNIESDPELFAFMVRHPEIIVNIWDIMGVTNVSVDRQSQFIFRGNDGAGTDCQAELIYGSDQVHIYYGNGSYDGTLTARELKGRCVCILHGQPVKQPSGRTIMVGQMDIFLKLDNLGVDLLARTIGPFVGKTADYNFIESAKFLGQISRAAERNPAAIQELASQMTKIHPNVRDEFMQVAARVAARNTQYTSAANEPAIDPPFLSPTTKTQRAQSDIMPSKQQLMLRR